MSDPARTPITSDRLEAFVAVATTSSFTRAARQCHVTQSAVSQRIAKLEAEIGATLFLRRRDAASLTAEGEALLRYARAIADLETDVIKGIRTATSGLSGVIRVAGFSSVVRSLVVPALTPIVSAFPEVVVHVFAREMHDLSRLLRSGEADFVLLDRSLSGRDIESRLVGKERNVLVECAARARAAKRASVMFRRFLDHDPDDTITDRFAREHLKDGKVVARSYLDDIYGILDGVSRGWGMAVVSEHLLREFPRVRKVPGHRALETPVYLCRRRAVHQTRLHEDVAARIVTHGRQVLEAGR